jgi:Ca2+-binding RTX toxin-like protein
VDTFTGTVGNDSFIADNSGTNVTSLADSLNGGSGNDTLTVYGFTANDAVPPALSSAVNMSSRLVPVNADPLSTPVVSEKYWPNKLLI